MMMNDDLFAGDHPIQQQSFLHQLREQMLLVDQEWKRADEGLMMAEVDVRFAEQQQQELQRALDAQSAQLVDAQAQRDLQAQLLQHFQEKRDLLLDLEEALSGTLQAHQLRFFTCSQLDFAHQLGLGEITLQQQLDALGERFLFHHQGHSYVFLQLADGSYWFRAEALSGALFDFIQGVVPRS